MEENKVEFEFGQVCICFFCDRSVKITIRLAKAWAKLATLVMVSVLTNVTWFYKYPRAAGANGKGVTSLP